MDHFRHQSLAILLNSWAGTRMIWTGAEDRDRTGDLPITNRLLYQLSYLGSRCFNLASPKKCVKRIGG